MYSTQWNHVLFRILHATESAADKTTGFDGSTARVQH